MSSLPNTRTLLTSLFDTLTTPIPPQNQPPDQRPGNEPYDPPSNPLKMLPPGQKALLSTMHVLFTPPMLLQALDLLDRGFVFRIVEKKMEAEGGAIVREGGTGKSNDFDGQVEVFPPQAAIHLPPPSSPTPLPSTSLPDANPTSSKTPTSRPKTPPTIHQVRSSQPPKSRFRDASTLDTSSIGTNIYTVRLQAWNCSCAAFAFASFPTLNIYPQRSAWDVDSEGDEGDGEELFGLGRRGEGGFERNMHWGEEEWEFGGLSVDRKQDGNGGGVPCCKHLLACVLGERWDVLRGYVKERFVTREEMAGLGCED